MEIYKKKWKIKKESRNNSNLNNLAIDQEKLRNYAFEQEKKNFRESYIDQEEKQVSYFFYMNSQLW